MELKRLVFVAALGAAASLLIGTASWAQGVPAEQPSASFTGDQYVDSQGCVFIRAGVGGATEWIPRVGRDRNQICGQTPSTGARTVAAQTPRPGTAASASAGVVVIGGATQTPTRTMQPTTPPRQTVAAPAPRTVQTPAPRIVTAPAPAAPTRPVAPAAPVVTGCPGLNSQYFRGEGVRCGPQAVHPGDAARGINRPGVTLDPASFTPAPIVVPEGYREAFDDGRFNPARGVGTAAGAAQMALVWTNTVPRELVDANTGRVVTHLFPRLRPEDASMSEQAGTVDVTASTRSITPRARTVPAPSVEAEPARVTRQEIRVPADHRHVLAATYPDRAEADRAYARLAASGVPARLGQINRASGMVYAVVAGPFATPEALVQGLQTTRAVGFSGAITRR